MIEDKTRELMMHASLTARAIFAQLKPDTTLPPMWMIESGANEVHVIATPFPASNVKDAVAAFMRKAMYELEAVRYVFVTECWMAHADSLKAAAIIQPRDHPDHMEAIRVEGADHQGSASLTFRIERPANGPPTVQQEGEWRDTGIDMGRFSDMLPHRGRVQ